MLSLAFVVLASGGAPIGRARSRLHHLRGGGPDGGAGLASGVPEPPDGAVSGATTDSGPDSLELGAVAASTALAGSGGTVERGPAVELSRVAAPPVPPSRGFPVALRPSQVLARESEEQSREALADASFLASGGGGGGGGYEAMRGAVRREMSSRFRPELLNRLDEVVVFEALSRAEVSEVAQLYLAQLQRRCADEMQISLDLSPALSDAIVERGYSPAYGARPLRRAVQALCEDAVAEASLDGFVGEGESLGLDSDGEGRVLLRNKRGKTRTYEPATAAGGIEGGDAAESAALLSDGLPKANPLGLP